MGIFNFLNNAVYYTKAKYHHKKYNDGRMFNKQLIKLYPGARVDANSKQFKTICHTVR